MKTITEMAREADVLIFDRLNLITSDIDGLKRFAELVRAEAQAEEREACAKVCEEEVGVWPSLGPRHCAEAIRARGTA